MTLSPHLSARRLLLALVLAALVALALLAVTYGVYQTHADGARAIHEIVSIRGDGGGAGGSPPHTSTSHGLGSASNWLVSASPDKTQDGGGAGG